MAKALANSFFFFLAIESRVARIKARVAELTGGAGEKGAPANP